LIFSRHRFLGSGFHISSVDFDI